MLEREKKARGGCGYGFIVYHIMLISCGLHKFQAHTSVSAREPALK